MSLLLDALKRAEQEKHSKGDRSPASSREPMMPPAEAMESLTLQPIASATPERRGEAGTPAQAQTMFQAKAPPPADGAPNRGILWVILGTIVVVTLAAGAYIWMQLQALTPRVTAAGPAPAERRPPAAPTAAPASSERAPSSPTLATQPPPLYAATPLKLPPTAPPRETLVRELVEGARATPAPAPLAFARAPEPARIAPSVAAGYQALRANDLPAARRHYEAAVAAEPRGIDALLGLATVLAQSGDRAAAAMQYRRALEVDPRSATALAGLAALADYARPEALEPQLREDLARSPANATLHFALGNLYASQSRWNDAQASFFEAYRHDPTNSDIAHNLAVSLDQLGKTRLAAEFYQRALEGTGRFDRAQVVKRLGELGAAR